MAVRGLVETGVHVKRVECHCISNTAKNRLILCELTAQGMQPTKPTPPFSQAEKGGVHRVLKSRPFRWTPWDLISEKLHMVVSGER